MGESAALTLCTIGETGARLKYICFNTSLKITSGKKAHETHRLVKRRGGNDDFFCCFFSETPRFQPGAGRGSCLWALWLVTNDIIPRAGPPPIPTMSSVPKHVSDVMQGGPLQAAPHFLFHFSLLSLFVCLSSLLRIAQIRKKKENFCNCLVALYTVCRDMPKSH